MIIILIILYIVSIIVCLIFREEMEEEIKSESTITDFFNDQFIIDIVTYVPIVNTIAAYTIFMDWIRMRYTLWLVKQLVKKIENKELKDELNELLK